MPKDQHTRRTFLQQVTAGLGAGALMTLGAQRAAYSFPDLADDEKLGIALVGLGNYSTGKLAPAFAETKLCRLAGIVTGTPSKAETWKAKYNIPDANIYNYETFDRIADNPDIDIVYVVLPNSMHAEYTIRAAQAGKHVITEKPMSTSVADAEAMIAACKAANRRLAVGYRLHYEPFNIEARRLGQEKVFGAVKMLETSDGFRIGNPTQWRLRHAMAGGGAMMDVGIYALQASRYVTGEEPIAVTAQEYKTDPVKFAEVDETLFWQLEFPSGAVAHSATTYAASVERLFATCERGWFEFGPIYGYGHYTGRTSEGPIDLPQTVHQALHMDAVTASIVNDTPISASGEEGLRDMIIIEAIYKAVASGGRVEINI
jgi:predicted dehydrogenase